MNVPACWRNFSAGKEHSKNIGELPEWLNGTVSKTVVSFYRYPGFESLTLRQLKKEKGK